MYFSNNFLCSFLFRTGTVYIYIKVIFENLTHVPTEGDVISAANDLLESNKSVRDLGIEELTDPVSIKNITYQSKYLSLLVVHIL